MEINGVSNHHHRHRFHTLFTTTTTTTTATDFSGDELTEADLFSDSSESTHSPVSLRNNELRFCCLKKSGILAALTDDSGNRFSVAATPYRTIPKPRVVSELTQSLPIRKFYHQQKSAPVNVPMMMKNPKKLRQLDEFSDNEGDDEEEMLPPHEIVAMKLKSTSSVLEGVGRTLKGRDLRQVRNAVWRQTGFLD